MPNRTISWRLLSGLLTVLAVALGPSVAETADVKYPSGPRFEGTGELDSSVVGDAAKGLIDSRGSPNVYLNCLWGQGCYQQPRMDRWSLKIALFIMAMAIVIIVTSVWLFEPPG
ncbi:hypothetical protein EN780_06620 [Mesorhizobium sp. M4B.F.Ca.ET.089.01.1.1]|uniref:hypothetical protein n=1 Tax=Mesorhizobium sp. M4B.F.Ca.ET.089.01.1.1 TaxID=2496662 RepID=UPI000FE313A0|nr:hypothetical protein [Mesorhizobium sp. M4B.F.Ca.ET.089.01.1.1]RWX69346.1 hypothetical protein EN780_06620 [Mesorhizobium sp. M4B.F.Ca.ET.089.01.1.1]